jgi:Fe-S-cluster-containing dehydrogenase component
VVLANPAKPTPGVDFSEVAEPLPLPKTMAELKEIWKSWLIQLRDEQSGKAKKCIGCYDRVESGLEPACVSACIVGALEKNPMGPVTYDAWKCIGCRYCMVACPFEIPAYEYNDPITPRVMKCTFCYGRMENENKLPGCAEICPVEAITFGKRIDLITLAHQRIDKNPGRYIDHVYGEKEVGGTSWMYITGEPFEKLGFNKLPDKPMPKLAETIQHNLFSYLWSPIVLFGMLSGMMWAFRDKGDGAGKGREGDNS